MNVCDNLGDHLVGNVYIKVSTYNTVYISYDNASPSSIPLSLMLILDEYMAVMFMYIRLF